MNKLENQVVLLLAGSRFRDVLRLGDTFLSIGDLDTATNIYKLLLSAPDFALVSTCRLALVERTRKGLRRSDSVAQDAGWVLVWQKSKELEGSFFRQLLGEVTIVKEVDNFDYGSNKSLYTYHAKKMIVFDDVIRNQSAVDYYCRAATVCDRIVLFHQSDEAYEDHREIYPLVDLVFRNYWMPLGEANVRYLPLGPAARCECTGPREGSAATISWPDRKFLWSFAGDVKNKPHREVALRAFSGLRRGFTHQVQGFHSTEKLGAENYCAVLRESVFSLCPSGGINPETFRLYESLDAGAIPLMLFRERNYINHLFGGSSPLLAFENWAEARNFVERIESDAIELGVIRNAIREWWTSWRLRCKHMVSKGIVEL